MFVRGLVRLITSRAKRGYGLAIVGLYCLVGVAFVIVGVFAASSPSGVNFDGQLPGAILGIPGPYTVKNEQALVAVRVLGAVLVLCPFGYRWLVRKFPNKPVIREIESVIP